MKLRLKGLDLCSVGDLVCVEWCYASTGKSSANGGVIDIPVKSWGIYVGLFGSRTRHIVLAHNSFQYADGFYDLDYTAVPVSWVGEVKVLDKGHFPQPQAANLVNSFLLRDRRVFTNSSKSSRHRPFQRRMVMHARHH